MKTLMTLLIVMTAQAYATSSVKPAVFMKDRRAVDGSLVAVVVQQDKHAPTYSITKVTAFRGQKQETLIASEMMCDFSNLRSIKCSRDHRRTDGGLIVVTFQEDRYGQYNVVLKASSIRGNSKTELLGEDLNLTL